MWLCHSAPTGCVAPDTSICVSVHLSFYVSSNVESSRNGFWFSLFGTSGTMGSVAVSVSQSNTRPSRPGVGSQSVPTIDFTSSGSLDWMVGTLFDAVYFEHTTCRSNQQHVASLHQAKVESSVPPIIVFYSVRDCFSKWWQFQSIWFSLAQFTRRPVVFGGPLGYVQKLCRALNCIDPQEKLHSVIFLTRMDHCSRHAQNFPDRPFDTCCCDSAAPLSSKITSAGPTVSLNC